MTGRPSVIVSGNLVLNRRGAAMLVAALDAAMKLAGRDGVDYAGRSGYSDVAWLRGQAQLVAEGRTGPASPDSAEGTPPVPFRWTPPSSGALWSTRQAAVLLRCTRRAVVKAIGRGVLPATRIDRTWVLRELDVRTYAAKNGRRDDDAKTGQGHPTGRAAPDALRSA